MDASKEECDGEERLHQERQRHAGIVKVAHKLEAHDDDGCQLGQLGHCEPRHHVRLRTGSVEHDRVHPVQHTKRGRLQQHRHGQDEASHETADGPRPGVSREPLEARRAADGARPIPKRASRRLIAVAVQRRAACCHCSHRHRSDHIWWRHLALAIRLAVRP